MFRSKILVSLALTLVSSLILTGCGKGTGTTTAPVANSDNNYQVRGKTTLLTFPKAGLYASLTFNEFPQLPYKKSSFSLRFWSIEKGSPQTGPFLDPGFELTHPNIKLWMVMPNGFAHGSSDKMTSRKVVETNLGVEQVSFQLEDVYFTMDGTWQIHLDLIKNGSFVDKAVLFYEVPEV